MGLAAGPLLPHGTQLKRRRNVYIDPLRARALSKKKAKRTASGRPRAPTSNGSSVGTVATTVESADAPDAARAPGGGNRALKQLALSEGFVEMSACWRCPPAREGRTRGRDGAGSLPAGTEYRCPGRWQLLLIWPPRRERDVRANGGKAQLATPKPGSRRSGPSRPSPPAIGRSRAAVEQRTAAQEDTPKRPKVGPARGSPTNNTRPFPPSSTPSQPLASPC